jgi:hypothetical protein
VIIRTRVAGSGLLRRTTKRIRGADIEDRRLARQRSYFRSDVIFLKKIEKSSCCDEIRSFA